MKRETKRPLTLREEVDRRGIEQHGRLWQPYVTFRDIWTEQIDYKRHEIERALGRVPAAQLNLENEQLLKMENIGAAFLDSGASFEALVQHFGPILEDGEVHFHSALAKVKQLFNLRSRSARQAIEHQLRDELFCAEVRAIAVAPDGAEHKISRRWWNGSQSELAFADNAHPHGTIRIVPQDYHIMNDGDAQHHRDDRWGEEATFNWLRQHRSKSPFEVMSKELLQQILRALGVARSDNAFEQAWRRHNRVEPHKPGPKPRSKLKLS
jgi:hypothetical protein